MSQDDKIDALKDLINAIQNNVNNSLNLIVACLGICIAIAGAALYFLAKQLIESRVNKELNVIKQELESKLELVNRNNPQFLWAKGNMWVSEDNIVQITGLASSIDLDLPNRITLKTQKGDKELKYDVTIDERNVLTIKLKNYSRIEDGNMLKWEIIWLNPKYISG